MMITLHSPFFNVSYPLNSHDGLRCYRRLEEARDVYKKVLEMDPRHFTALAFLGKVYHMLDDIDSAIVKYHEVRSL